MFSHVSMISHSLDTVEYPVLHSHLKSAGISGKTWQLIRNWKQIPSSLSVSTTSSLLHLMSTVVLVSVLSFYL